MITEDTAWLMVEASRILQRPFRGLRIAELGNQWSGWQLSAPVKLIAEWLGAHHQSFDINGLDGSIITDLSMPIANDYCGIFDLVTNAGTTEHVNTTLDYRDQYHAFRNIHYLAAFDSCMMHVVPSEKGAHCGCRYVYTHKFFDSLQRMCGYELLQHYDSKSDENHIAALLLKSSTSIFPSWAEFQELIAPEILRKQRDIMMPQRNISESLHG